MMYFQGLFAPPLGFSVTPIPLGVARVKLLFLTKIGAKQMNIYIYMFCCNLMPFFAIFDTE